MRLKISSAKFRSSCLGPKVLNDVGQGWREYTKPKYEFEYEYFT